MKIKKVYSYRRWGKTKEEKKTDTTQNFGQFVKFPEGAGTIHS